MKRYFGLALAALLSGMALPTPAQADLQEIISAGKVRIGVPVDVPPFGFVDEKNEPAGLDVDVARMLAEALGVELELTQITGANRIPFLVTDKLDLVISAMGARHPSGRCRSRSPHLTRHSRSVCSARLTRQ